MLKVIELFAGIGAPRKALQNIGIEHEILGISEIDSTIVTMYNSLYGKTFNFGNVALIKELPYCDLIHFSSPCTSFSNCGKKDGLDGESGLIKEVYRLFNIYEKKNTLPKYFTFENVPALIEKFPIVFQEFLDFFEKKGYNIYYSVLNALYYNCPQKRERLCVVGIRKDLDNGKFKMPDSTTPTELRIRDMLEPVENIPESYYHPAERETNRHFRVRAIPKNTLQTIEMGYYFTPKSKSRTQSNRIYSRDGVAPTLTTSQFINLEEGTRLRKIMPIETWRLMGFTTEDFNKVKNNTDTALLKSSGNSICVPVMEAIYRNLFDAQAENIT